MKPISVADGGGDDLSQRRGDKKVAILDALYGMAEKAANFMIFIPRAAILNQELVKSLRLMPTPKPKVT